MNLCTRACEGAAAPVSYLVYQREVTHEELGVESELQELCGQHNIKTHEVWGATLYHLQVGT
jgi:hypothetical protein